MSAADDRPTPRLGMLMLLVLASIAPSVWLFGTLADVPAMIVASAAVPAAVFAWLVVRVDRADPEPRAALVAALAAGAVLAAYASHTANAWLLEWTGRFADAGSARPLAAGFGAPIVEELAKAAVLALLAASARGLVVGTRDGIVYGALVGIGFAFTENVVSLTFAVLQGGPAGLLRAVYVRALLGGGNHAAFTATTGAALGWTLASVGTPGRWLVAAIGLALATLQHVVWNSVAAIAISGVLCGPELGGARCLPAPSDVSLFVYVPLLTAIFIGPGVLTLGAIAGLADRREK